MSIDDFHIFETWWANPNAHTVCVEPIDGWQTMSADDIIKDIHALCMQIDPNFGKPTSVPTQMNIDNLWFFPTLCHGYGWTLGTGHSSVCPSIVSCPPTERTPAPALACECGVKFTGGLHSDWCPRVGT